MSSAPDGDIPEGASPLPSGAQAALALPEVRSRLAAQSAAWNAGMRAERARIKAIVQHEEAKGREPLAITAALDTLMSPDEAIAMMRTAHKTAQPATGE